MKEVAIYLLMLKGANDCMKGRQPARRNKYYLSGYGNQYGLGDLLNECMG